MRCMKWEGNTEGICDTGFEIRDCQLQLSKQKIKHRRPSITFMRLDRNSYFIEWSKKSKAVSQAGNPFINQLSHQDIERGITSIIATLCIEEPGLFTFF